MGSEEFEKAHNKKAYDECIKTATIRRDKGKLKLCPRGYCTAKTRFEVYPSAYANGYAVTVCKGENPDAENKISEDPKYMERLQNLSKKSERKTNPLNRWYREQWVNLCEKDENGPGGFAVCGTGKGIENPENYPYCRAYDREEGTQVVTAKELKQYFPEYIEKMCAKKRSLPQGIDGKPTRVSLPKYIIDFVKKQRKLQKGGSKLFDIPKNVKTDAELGLRLHENGFKGGTKTGWDRAKQLVSQKSVDIDTLYQMKVWFARHGPDAKNGGTSYPGYCKWLEEGHPIDSGKNNYRGAVAWLIWGGDAAYNWLKQPTIKKALREYRPKSKQSTDNKNLFCEYTYE